MKKKPVHALTLNRETLLQLEGFRLSRAEGGSIPDRSLVFTCPSVTQSGNLEC